MDERKIKKCIAVIVDCRSRQNEIYSIIGKYKFRDEIGKDLRTDAEEYQKIIDKQESIIKKCI